MILLRISLVFTLAVTSASALDCFQGAQELRDAVDQYLKSDSAAKKLGFTYGYPMGEWCVKD
eukprot:CAMPEP_0117079732 /NCGR_PEP_ID=MMETSP0472-20121206/56275_1 /TAXON_ID=693140 ORGANISM="Tiarina fusus, Strain LIS" /NCGR_SAMPLE_ID=MMETSP0472 /ASSEMBLY_ACC=CAM_ASM_000603 /LENGTH=61 /DNA_ID=CAMNT_0004807121 /DNA_START=41 /DNA_END=223 /DNA_ORIENTATION=-